jgi:hypothetical protein
MLAKRLISKHSKKMYSRAFGLLGMSPFKHSLWRTRHDTARCRDSPQVERSARGMALPAQLSHEDDGLYALKSMKMRIEPTTSGVEVEGLTTRPASLFVLIQNINLFDS